MELLQVIAVRHRWRYATNAVILIDAPFLSAYIIYFFKQGAPLAFKPNRLSKLTATVLLRAFVYPNIIVEKELVVNDSNEYHFNGFSI